jgi:ribosomal protein S18 acetylase RimI-like enzyme
MKLSGISKDKFTFTSRQPAISGSRLSICFEDSEIGHAYLYILRNDIHEEPFAYLEDVYVEQQWRGSPAGEALVTHAINVAKEAGCYKIIGNVKHEHVCTLRWYRRFGFLNKANEVRIDF